MSDFPAYNVVDIMVLVFLAIGLIQGLKRGLSGEIARLIGTVAAVWAGWHFYHPLGEKLQEITLLRGSQALAAAFIITLIGVFLVMLVLRMILHKIMEITFKGGTLERLGGALAGIIRMLLGCTAVIFFLCLFPNNFIQTHVAEGSITGRIVTRHVPGAYNAVRSALPGMPELPEPVEHDAETYDDDAGYDESLEVPAGEDSEEYPMDDAEQ